MKVWPRVLTVALLAAAVWFGIGVWQRTRAGLDFEAAARAELPLTLVIFVVAAGWVLVSDRVRGRK
ncbi:hypothetical protein L1280_002296 [Deinococcus sp. HSC-46F16]|uniref:hypothetical protein n=1 Tax=Deinococcus sp. HSC-46F16 TaxID=2910968 RepID=UPI00209F5937|nr:hypothetical protein [Deinococcus sp. HSC-46F16]MCP2015135.1 hypothetical protein [Deinococcus sp. HSC-46F16]